MTALPRVGVLGGTFDPIHYGHLDAAAAAASALSLDQVLLIPSHQPPHRAAQPHVSAYHRFAMVALAVEEHAGYTASDLELAREGPSFTIDTLRALHACGWQASQIFFILGADAFAEIATWREFPSVLGAAHFAVIARPGVGLIEALARVPAATAGVRALSELRDGGTATHVVPVEATTRNVSSTGIRECLAAGRPIDHMVPAMVAAHVRRHHLYGAVDDLHGKEQRGINTCR